MGYSGRHAIVIGASMGGLAAARVLADRYQHVTVLDRDTLAQNDQHRRGVPHGRHAHGLLAGGLNVLETWFPGIARELTARGAILRDVLADSIWFNHGVRLAQCRSGLTGLLLSRPMLECHVRRRLGQLTNVQIFDDCRVLFPVFNSDRSTVIGVQFEVPQSISAKKTLSADLVIDATGRSSRSPAWLAANGYAPPQEEKVEVGISYTTRLYRRSPGQVRGNQVVVVRSQAPHYRFGVALAQEDDRWIVTLGGYLGDSASADDEGFRTFAQSLPAPEIHAIINSSEPLSNFCGFRFPASVRRRYDRLARFPHGYLVLGDALASFNPAYGQGMTAALLEADALAACLAMPQSEGLAQRFFPMAANIIDTPWKIAVGADLANPNVEAHRSLPGRFFNWYIRKLYLAGARDTFLARRFIAVANLVASPASLLSPTTVLRTLMGNLRRASKPAGRLALRPASLLHAAAPASVQPSSLQKTAKPRWSYARKK